MTEPETQQDQEQLSSSERCKLARLALRLGYDAEPIWPDVVHEAVTRLDRKIEIADRAARATHWSENAAKAQEAAVYYLQSQTTGKPVSLAAAAEEFGTSERSVSRHIRLLRKAAEPEKGLKEA